MHLLGSEVFFQDSCSPNIAHELAAPVGGLGPRKSWFLSTVLGKYTWYYPPKGFFSITDGRYGSLISILKKTSNPWRCKFFTLAFFLATSRSSSKQLGDFFFPNFLFASKTTEISGCLRPRSYFQLLVFSEPTQDWFLLHLGKPKEQNPGEASMGPKRVSKKPRVWKKPWSYGTHLEYHGWVQKAGKIIIDSTQKNWNSWGKGGIWCDRFLGGTVCFQPISMNFWFMLKKWIPKPSPQ